MKADASQPALQTDAQANVKADASQPALQTDAQAEMKADASQPALQTDAQAEMKADGSQGSQAASKPAELPTAAAMAAEFAKFRKGWLANRKSCCASLLRKADLHNRELQVLQVTSTLVCAVLKVVRAAMERVLPPGPMFIITDYKTAASDHNNGSIGLTTWGATFVRQPRKNTQEWWHEPTCPKTEKSKRIAMFLYAKYCNSDWVLAPVVALLLRELLPWASSQDAAAAVGLVEFPVDPTLPVYQFLDENGGKQFMRSKTADVFHCVRLGQGVEASQEPISEAASEAEYKRQQQLGQPPESETHLGQTPQSGPNKSPKFAVVDVVTGFQIADPNKTNHKLEPVDVDLALFLLFRNAKLRRMTDSFDAALDDCQKRAMAVLAAQACLFSTAGSAAEDLTTKPSKPSGPADTDYDDYDDDDDDDDDSTAPPPPTPESDV